MNDGSQNIFRYTLCTLERDSTGAGMYDRENDRVCGGL
jgi:hypothetical protein